MWWEPSIRAKTRDSIIYAQLLRLPAVWMTGQVPQKSIWKKKAHKKKPSGMVIRETVDNYVQSLPPILVCAGWDNLFTTFPAFFIVSLGFVDVCVHRRFWYFLPLLHRVFVFVCVCVCVFSLLSLCFTFNLGLHCKQIHSPVGGPAG